jgi:hypothetical protein
MVNVRFLVSCATALTKSYEISLPAEDSPLILGKGLVPDALRQRTKDTLLLRLSELPSQYQVLCKSVLIF